MSHKIRLANTRHVAQLLGFDHTKRGWLPWVRRRRFKLQADVTHAIEELGGYWPYPD